MPVLIMGYCHCKDYRAWNPGPVNAFTLWKSDTVTVTAGAEFLATYMKTEACRRQFCTKCGGHVMTDHPVHDLVDIKAAILPSLAFKSGVHINYESTVMRIKDGLPKLKDFPAEMGGSGEVLPE